MEKDSYKIKELLQLEESKPMRSSAGLIIWKLPNGEIHRKHGPAVVWPNGLKEWYKNGKRHRDNGPAIECPSGEKEWWDEGIRIRKQYGAEDL